MTAEVKVKKSKKRAKEVESASSPEISPNESDSEPCIKVAKNEKKSKKSSSTSASSSEVPAFVSPEQHVSSGNCPVFHKKYSAAARKILEKRATLPCFGRKAEFLELVNRGPVTILVGETGSGKTTQMPQMLAECYAQEGKRIAVTQPRRVAAMSVATRVADEMDVELGEEVGYSIRFEDKTSDKTKIKFMTDGMLLREAMTDPLMSSYSVICLDEAHERTLATDILFGLLKALVKGPRKDDLKLICMSATLEAEKFQKYFLNAPLITVSGRMHPVETFYSCVPEKDYVSACVDTVVNITEYEGEGDVLVFLTGEEEIERCCEQISLGAKNVTCLPLYSSLPPAKQRKVFEPTRDGSRKVVVATNIAETSITIDGVVFVVDPGLSKSKVYNPRTNIDSLLVQPIARSAAVQRSGRAGRTRPGKCFRLYTESSFQDNLLAAQHPEILRTNLASMVLTLFNLGVEDVVHFDFIDPPSPECLMRALEMLLKLGALSDEGELTETGKSMAEFPLDPQFAKMLLAAGEEEFDIEEEMCSVIAMMNVPPVFMRDRMNAKSADRAHKDFHKETDGDHATLLNVFQQYEAIVENRRNPGDDAEPMDPLNWCWENYLKDRSLQQALSIKKQLLRLVQKKNGKLGKMTRATGVGFNHETRVVTKANKDERGQKQVYNLMRQCLIHGFFTQVAYCCGKNYITLRDKQVVDIHPGSVLKHMPEWILYHELVLTDKNFVRTVSAMRPEWLLEHAPQYFPSEVKQEEAAKSLKRAAERM